MRARWIEERAFEPAQDLVVGSAAPLRAQGRYQYLQESQAQVEVLKLCPRNPGHQKASPPCATLRGLTFPTTNRAASLVALENMACPTSSARMRSGRSIARPAYRMTLGLAFCRSPQTALMSSATLS